MQRPDWETPVDTVEEFADYFCLTDFEVGFDRISKDRILAGFVFQPNHIQESVILHVDLNLSTYVLVTDFFYQRSRNCVDMLAFLTAIGARFNTTVCQQIIPQQLEFPTANGCLYMSRVGESFQLKLFTNANKKSRDFILDQTQFLKLVAGFPEWITSEIIVDVINKVVSQEEE